MPYEAIVRKMDMGWIALAASERGLAALTLPRKNRKLAEFAMKKSLKDEKIEIFSDPHHMLDGFFYTVVDYFKGEAKDFPFDLDLSHGSEFDRTVWKVVRRIPYGETRSYKWVAVNAGRPEASRAVGGAVGKNPMPIVVPCHRVIRSDGSVGGFGSGVRWKKRLLKLERKNISNF